MVVDTRNYGIVVDSGSSGSRLQVYSWENPVVLKLLTDLAVLSSPPKITQRSEWAMKISPGISSFKDKPEQVWTDHYAELMDFALKIVPLEKHSETPVFVLATAGMRMLEVSQQNHILGEVCTLLQQKTNFYVPNCAQFVQLIDGETEGLYGWIGLNYLMGQFENYTEKEHESIGFMDMGGASTQIAFVPSSDQIEKHRDDLSSIILRNVNGQNQEWSVFVETWLGFGANQARQRYLEQLINLSLINSRTADVNDPCLPKGAEIQHTLGDKLYSIKGTGNYEICLKTIYPLLLKHIPCKEEPCLFNGIHGPKLDFDKDKFVGISEYWYTANDILGSGGEYNYHTFNEKVREYCESDWNNIMENYNNGHYSKLDPEKFLKSACFKASWVINILHDGFDLPRLGIEIPKNEEGKSENLDNVHIPFKSANSINGDELSWTLGKILLFASSQITSAEESIPEVGIYPSELSGKKFVPEGGIRELETNLGNRSNKNTLASIILFFVLAYCLSILAKKVFKVRRLRSPKFLVYLGSKVPGVQTYFQLDSTSQLYQNQNSINLEMEEGLMPSKSNESPHAFLRTRLNINLSDQVDIENLHIGRNANNLINKPFPKRNASYFFKLYSNNSSRESLVRNPSTASLGKHE